MKNPLIDPVKQSTPPTLASLADKHAIYQKAVQSPEQDILLLQHIYFTIRGAMGHHLREDFCGTALTLAHWINQGVEFSGEGFDIDTDPVKWGLKHNFAPLGIAAERGVVHLADAREPSDRVPDIRCAFNFSYWVFQQRAEMLDYFMRVRQDLAEGGVFIIDVTGGTESLIEEAYESDLGDFSCVWQQQNFSPIDHSADLTLTFRFSDGSEIIPPYRYRWRVWSIPELLSLLNEAGFKNSQVWWQQEEGEETNDFGFELTLVGHNDPCWVACIAAFD